MLEQLSIDADVKGGKYSALEICTFTQASLTKKKGVSADIPAFTEESHTECDF